MRPAGASRGLSGACAASQRLSGYLLSELVIIQVAVRRTQRELFLLLVSNDFGLNHVIQRLRELL